MRARPRIPGFVPTWEGAIAWYALKYCRKNSYRFPSVDVEDLYAEAYLIFENIRFKYGPPRVTCEKHFMALYKTSLHNTLIDLGVRWASRSARETPVGLFNRANDDALPTILEVADPASDLGPFLTFLREYSVECRLFVSMFDDPRKMEQFKKGYKKELVGDLTKRETRNEFLCRIIGIDPNKYKVSTALRSALTEWRQA